MKNLKKIALALCLAASLGAVSTSVMAESDPGRTVYAPGEAVDRIVNKVGEALNALEQGGDAKKVDALAKEALDMSKEVNMNDKVDAARSRANNKVKEARAALEKGANQEAEAALRDAQKRYEDLKKLF